MKIQTIRKELVNHNSFGVIQFGGFEPIDIAGCVLWLRSDLGVTKGANPFPVSAWADQSGNGNNLTQAAGGSQPTWVDSQLNGYPAIRFSSDFLSKTDMVLTHPYTVFLVYKSTTIGTFAASDTVFAQESDIWGFYETDNVIWKNAIYDGTALIYNGGYLANNVFAVCSFIFNGANSYMYENTVERVSGAIAGAAASGFNLGAQTFGGRAYAGMDCVEVIIFNSALSNPNRALVENYLNGRYAIY